jgi:hypothetical protein
VPRTRVGDVAANLEETIRLAARGNKLHAALMVFPELGLSAYAIDDLLFQDALLAAVEQAIDRLVEVSRDLFSVLIVGAPIRRSGGLFNTAVVVHGGTILGVVPRRTCRTIANSTRSGISPPAPASATGRSRWRVARRRSESICCSIPLALSTSLFTWRYAKIFGRLYRLPPGPLWRARKSW